MSPRHGRYGEILTDHHRCASGTFVRNPDEYLTQPNRRSIFCTYICSEQMTGKAYQCKRHRCWWQGWLERDRCWSRWRWQSDSGSGCRRLPGRPGRSRWPPLLSRELWSRSTGVSPGSSQAMPWLADAVASGIAGVCRFRLRSTCPYRDNRKGRPRVLSSSASGSHFAPLSPRAIVVGRAGSYRVTADAPPVSTGVG